MKRIFILWNISIDFQIRMKQKVKVNQRMVLTKKSSLHCEIVLNRREKSNAIIRPMYERIIEIFDQTTQDKQLNSSFIDGKRKILFIRN